MRQRTQQQEGENVRDSFSADGAEITIRFSFFSGRAQSPGISSPCSLERCCLSVVTIDRPDNGQDLPLPINFAQLPDFEA
jgi:hypothetical protein